MNDDLDDLDRALFALPLEEPPAGLRTSIMRATVYANARVAVEPVARPWELVAGGVMLAVMTWLLIAIVSSKSAAGWVTADVLLVVRAFADPMTLEWLAAGAVATAAFWFAGDLNLRLPTRGAGT